MNENLKNHIEQQRSTNRIENIRSFAWVSTGDKKEQLIHAYGKIKANLERYTEIERNTTKAKIDLAQKTVPMIEGIRKELDKVRTKNKTINSFTDVCRKLFGKNTNRVNELIAIERTVQEEVTEKHFSSTSLIRIGEALKSNLNSKREAANALIDKAKKYDKYITYKEVISSLRVEDSKIKKNLNDTSITPTELLASIKSMSTSSELIDVHDVELIFECAEEILKLTSKVFIKSNKNFAIKGARSQLTEVWSDLKLDTAYPVN